MKDWKKIALAVSWITLMLFVMIGLGGCASTGEQDQALQGGNRAVSATFNSAATTESGVTLESGLAPLGQAGMEAEVTVGENTVLIKTTGPVRDLNIFTDKVEMTASSTISGTASDTSQGRTDTPSTQTNPEATVTPTGK